MGKESWPDGAVYEG
jgi:hypothetical protein